MYKLTRSAVRLTKNGKSLSIEHATEIASLIGHRCGADKYKQAFSKPLGAQFVYLCTFCSKSTKSKRRNREDVSEHNLIPIWKLL